jgi:hypothetical protein
MRFRHEGNGGDKVQIHTSIKAEGYALIFPDKIEPLAAGVPVFLSRTLEAWVRDNPQKKIRCALPIIKDGQTIAIHLWFDEGGQKVS